MTEILEWLRYNGYKFSMLYPDEENFNSIAVGAGKGYDWEYANVKHPIAAFLFFLRYAEKQGYKK